MSDQTCCLETISPNLDSFQVPNRSSVIMENQNVCDELPSPSPCRLEIDLTRPSSDYEDNNTVSSAFHVPLNKFGLIPEANNLYVSLILCNLE